MRRFFPPALVLATLSLGASFESGAGVEPGPPPYNLVLEGTLPDATVLNVVVDGLDNQEADPIALTMVGGKVRNGISIPAAKGRRIDLRAENSDGKVLYEGAVEIDIGTYFTPQVSLEMKSALDGAPGELTLASHRVALSFAAVEREGKTFTRLTADVFDANGQQLEVKGDELAWEIDDPWVREHLEKCPGPSGHSVCADFQPMKPGGTPIALNACFRGGICRIELIPPFARVWELISVGLGHHTCALKRDGSAYCWGQGERGQLGSTVPKDCASNTGPAGPTVGSWGCSAFPVAVVCPNGPCDFLDISAGTEHTCAVAWNGEAWCWGSNSFGELGIGVRTTSGIDVPTLVSTSYRFTKIRAAAGMTCGLTTLSKVACWGNNALAIVPANTNPVVTRPEIVDLPTRASVTALDASFTHACAKTASGDLFCWGSNADLKLGSSQFAPAPNCSNCPAEPRLMQGAGIGELGTDRVSLVSAGAHGTCAHLNNAKTVCWGRGVPRFGAPVPIEVLSLGEAHYCAIGGGVLRCAGNGVLGDGLDEFDASGPGRGPVAMAGKHRNFREVDVGFNSCAIGYDEQIYCWGDNAFGALGLGFSVPGSPGVLVPTVVSFPTAPLSPRFPPPNTRKP